VLQFMEARHATDQPIEPASVGEVAASNFPSAPVTPLRQPAERAKRRERRQRRRYARARALLGPESGAAHFRRYYWRPFSKSFARAAQVPRKCSISITASSWIGFEMPAGSQLQDSRCYATDAWSGATPQKAWNIGLPTLVWRKFACRDDRPKYAPRDNPCQGQWN
jgi:hypothetical protein